MNSINKFQLKREAKILANMSHKFKRISGQFREYLENRGYTLVELGTSCYTFTGDVGIKHISGDQKKYFGVGVYFITRKAHPVYRAYIKLID